MPELPMPAAARLPRARWLDTRLVIGLLLVLVSVVIGTKVIAEADDTVTVWGVTRDMGPGVRLGKDDLVRRDVRLDGDPARYVWASGEPPVDYVLTRAVGRDELLPANAVAEQGAAELRRLAVEVDRVSTTGLRPGAVVDVYVVPETRLGGSDEPSESEVVLTAVTVDEVDERAGGLGATGTRSGGVVLLLTPADAQQVLDAQARGSLRLLQLPGSADDARRS